MTFTLNEEVSLLPVIRIRCETTDNGITGTTYLPVLRVEQEDDGSFTVVTSYFPKD